MSDAYARPADRGQRAVGIGWLAKVIRVLGYPPPALGLAPSHVGLFPAHVLWSARAIMPIHLVAFGEMLVGLSSR